jgi:hypothetical protein
MKRLFLIAGLCIAAAMVVPVASASAAVKGTCVVNGLASFTEGLLTETTAKHGYTFASTQPVVCVENSGAVRKGKAKVEKGTFEGSCLKEGKSLAEGEGELELEALPANEKFKFKLAFTSNLGVVKLQVRAVVGEVPPEASGEANFFASTKDAAALCAAVGVKELEFTAYVTGEIK